MTHRARRWWSVLRASTGAGLVVTQLLSATRVIAQAKSEGNAKRAVSPHLTYVPHRVYDARKGKWTDFETLVQQANAAEVVFVGEQHYDKPGHALELALLEGLARRRGAAGGPVAVSMEMFERDGQAELDGYLAGTRDEGSFLAVARPWPNYTDDYRPLVELAKAQSWPVIGANLPRPMASMISHGGLTTLDTLNKAEHSSHVAKELSCPHDRYFALFGEAMGGHVMKSNTPAPTDSAKAAQATAQTMMQHYYEAQCAKDETMGESVARALTAARTRGKGALVVHFNGAFHTEYGLGTAERTFRRTGNVSHLLVSIVPTPDLDHIDVKPLKKLADYIVFTIAKAEN